MRVHLIGQAVVVVDVGGQGAAGLWVCGLYFRVEGSGFRVQGFEIWDFGVQGLGFEILELMVQGLGFGVLEFRV
jgi:hypothetical protein